jgi:membrane-associated PAP2 superfamily phosphatase
VGAACGLTIGMVRIIFGKHFLSDILFCWAMMWTVVMLIRWAWLGLTLLQMRRKRAINLNKSQLDGASP